MVGGDDDCSSLAERQISNGPHRTFWRSASWSSRLTPQDCSETADKSGGQFRHFPVPLTPRSQLNSKARSCLPPLQPLSITRRNLDEWPKAGSDDVGEWPQSSTPSGKGDLNRPGEGLKLDVSSFQKSQDSASGAALVRRDKIAFFDKECSKVADHIYVGGDAVARNREILRQHGITHVLNCVGFVCPEYFKSDLIYKTLWLQDSPTEDITSILYDVFDYFEEVREQGGRVLVHCYQGVSRSTSLVIAYLMWREGHSFDDAFQYVKAARGIANPNMGFACQLLQCQKRVHAIPLSPSSVLRMYRMAPHSAYDPLHLVPKMLNDPSPSCLDSRGAFIVHVPSAIYVWVGKNCEPVMERDAKAAAFQVVRYERAQGPIVTIEEGEEPSDFWDAFSNVSVSLNSSDAEAQVSKGLMKPELSMDVDKKKVGSYDVDFELFHKAITGGFVPPFSQLGAGHETHLPARESNWSILRRKFVSGSVKERVSASRGALYRVCSDSVLTVDADSRIKKNSLLSSDLSSSSLSPHHLSPSSSDSSTSSKLRSESPSISPSTSCSSNSHTSSPASSASSDSSILSSESSQTVSIEHTVVRQDTKPCSKSNLPPSKGSALSLAQRRGNLSTHLKLPTWTDGSSLSSQTRNISIAFNTSLACSPDGIQRVDNPASDYGTSHHTCENATSDKPTSGKESENSFVSMKPLPLSCKGQSVVDGSFEDDMIYSFKEVEKNFLSGRQQLPMTGLVESSIQCAKHTCSLVFRWPNLEKISELDAGCLDSKEVLLCFIPNHSKNKNKTGILYLWIGSCFDGQEGSIQGPISGNMRKVREIDWIQVGCDFLTLIDLPKDTPIEVVREKEEPVEFLKLLGSI